MNEKNPNPNRRTDWTVVTRAKGARFYRPVANLPEGLDWQGAVDAAKLVQADPTTKVYYVPRESSFVEDMDNILEDDGGRVPIRWDAAPAASYAAPAAPSLRCVDCNVPTVEHGVHARLGHAVVADTAETMATTAAALKSCTGATEVTVTESRVEPELAAGLGTLTKQLAAHVEGDDGERYTLILTGEQRTALIDALSARMTRMGTPVVEVNAATARDLLADAEAADTYAVRFAFHDGPHGGLSVKVNERGWSPSMGTVQRVGNAYDESVAIVQAGALKHGLENLKPEPDGIAAMLTETIR